MNDLKKLAAKAALDYVDDDMVIGVGSGSTVHYFIEELKSVKHRIEACVASSKETETLLKKAGIPVLDLNAVNEIPIYVDGADEVNTFGEMIKGGGGAQTGEKIIASVAKNFICIVDETKLVGHLGEFPLAVEVIPMARSFVARELVKLGGDPQYREGFKTDYGNIILDVYNLTIHSPMSFEDKINIIPGVVEHGLFAKRVADVILIGTSEGLKKIK